MPTIIDIKCGKMKHFKNKCGLRFYKDSLIGFWKTKNRNGIKYEGTNFCYYVGSSPFRDYGEEKLTCAN